MLFTRAVPLGARDAYRKDALAGIFVGFYTGAVFPFIGFIARDKLHASVSLIALMTASPYIGNMFALFYANAMEGRKKQPFVVWSGGTARALFLLMLFASTPLRFALLVSMIQIVAAIATPAYAAVMKEIYPDQQRGQIMAYIRVGMAAMAFLSTLLVGPLLSGQNYQYIFPIAGLIGVCSSIAFGTIRTADVDPTHPDNRKTPTLRFLWSTLLILRDDVNYRWFAVSIFIFGFGHLMVAPLFPVFQVDELRITGTQVAVLSTVTNVFGIVSYLYWGRYVDLRSPLKAVAINVLLITVTPIIYFISSDVWMLLPVSVIVGITMGGIDLSYFNSILTLAEDGKESQYQALHSFWLGVRGTTAPFLGAALVALFKANGQPVRYVFLISTAIMLVGFLTQLVWVRERHAST